MKSMVRSRPISMRAVFDSPGCRLCFIFSPVAGRLNAEPSGLPDGLPFPADRLYRRSVERDDLPDRRNVGEPVEAGVDLGERQGAAAQPVDRQAPPLVKPDE